MENFFIRDVDGEQQYVNLSEEAWAVINDDMRSFMNENEQSFAGFMNTVFVNFYENADATLSERRREYCERLRSTLVGLPMQSEIVARLAAAHVKALKARATAYPKGDGKKFRLNARSQDILDGHPDSAEYDSRRDYMKAVFEQYARLPAYAREQVFFKSTVDAVNNAAAAAKRIRITLSPTAEIAKPMFSVKPYGILQDKTKQFNYLVGYSEQLDERRAPTSEEHIACFRISRIKDVRTTAQSSFISKDKRAELENTIREKGVQFLSGELIDVKVSFTEKGFDDFNRLSYMRPQQYEKIDGGRAYIFHCTWFQAFNYFFRLGGEAQVIEPKELRESLRARFEEAAKAYAE